MAHCRRATPSWVSSTPAVWTPGAFSSPAHLISSSSRRLSREWLWIVTGLFLLAKVSSLGPGHTANKHTRELISTQTTSHKHNNKDPSRLQSLSPGMRVNARYRGTSSYAGHCVYNTLGHPGTALSCMLGCGLNAVGIWWHSGNLKLWQQQIGRGQCRQTRCFGVTTASDLRQM